jgi:hypothetical protein
MANNDDANHLAPSSHLFTLRIWPEDLGNGQTDWRGKVQHVNSGEARYFRDWPTLEAFVVGLMRESEPEGLGTGTAGEGQVGTPRHGHAETRGAGEP